MVGPFGRDRRDAVASSPDWSDWSPDGTELAVLQPVDGKSAISIVAADGSGTSRTLDLGGVEPDRMGRLAPNRRQRLAVPRPSASQVDDVALYSVGSDGTGLHPITSEAAPDIQDTPTIVDPEIAPDGAMLAYWTWGPSEPTKAMGSSACSTLRQGRNGWSTRSAGR